MVEGGRKWPTVLKRKLLDGIKHHQIALHTRHFRGYAHILGGEALLDQVTETHVGLRWIQIDRRRAFKQRDPGLRIHVTQKNGEQQAGQDQPFPLEQDAADLGQRQSVLGRTRAKRTFCLYCDRRYLVRGIHHLRRLSGVPSALRRARPGSSTTAARIAAGMPGKVTEREDSDSLLAEHCSRCGQAQSETDTAFLCGKATRDRHLTLDPAKDALPVPRWYLSSRGGPNRLHGTTKEAEKKAVSAPDVALQERRARAIRRVFSTIMYS